MVWHRKKHLQRMPKIEMLLRVTPPNGLFRWEIKS